MPPKKAPTSKKPSQTRADIPLEEPPTDEFKEFYTSKIRDLDHQLSRYQKKWNNLKDTNSQLEKKLDQLISDKREIVKFWKRQVDQRNSEIASINGRIVALQQSKDDEREGFEKHLQELRTDFQETRDNLSSQNMILGSKLAELEEFKEQKEDLLYQYANLEKELEDEEQSHQNNLTDLDLKNYEDKERLKKDMVLRINHVAAEFRKYSNKQMSETTKCTIRENVSISSQLAKMGDRTLEIVEENEKLYNKVTRNTQRIHELEELEKDLAKKNYSSQKIIQMLNDKCQHQEMCMDQLQWNINHKTDLEEKIKEMENEQKTLSQDLTKYQEEVLKFASETQSVKEKLSQTQWQRQAADQTLQKSVDILKNIFKAEDKERSDEKTDLEKPEYILEKISSVLSEYLGVDECERIEEMNSMIALSLSQPPSPDETLLSRRQMGKWLYRGPLSPICHYQLGDLGLIPRPEHTIPSFSDKVRAASSAQSNRQQCTKSIASQTKIKKKDGS